MVNIIQIKNGLSRYVDHEMLPAMAETGYKKIIFATGVAIALSRIEKLFDKLKANSLLTALEVFDSEGNVDIDIIVDELCKNIPRTGLTVDIPLIGDITLYDTDVRTAYSYIIGG